MHLFVKLSLLPDRVAFQFLSARWFKEVEVPEKGFRQASYSMISRRPPTCPEQLAHACAPLFLPQVHLLGLRCGPVRMENPSKVRK